MCVCDTEQKREREREREGGSEERETCVQISSISSYEIEAFISLMVAVISLLFSVPVPHKDFSDLYGEMSGKGARVSEAHRRCRCHAR